MGQSSGLSPSSLAYRTEKAPTSGSFPRQQRIEVLQYTSNHSGEVWSRCTRSKENRNRGSCHTSHAVVVALDPSPSEPEPLD